MLAVQAVHGSAICTLAAGFVPSGCGFSSCDVLRVMAIVDDLLVKKVLAFLVVLTLMCNRKACV